MLFYRQQGLRGDVVAGDNGGGGGTPPPTGVTFSNFVTANGIHSTQFPTHSIDPGYGVGPGQTISAGGCPSGMVPTATGCVAAQAMPPPPPGSTVVTSTGTVQREDPWYMKWWGIAAILAGAGLGYKLFIKKGA